MTRLSPRQLAVEEVAHLDELIRFLGGQVLEFTSMCTELSRRPSNDDVLLVTAQVEARLELSRNALAEAGREYRRAAHAKLTLEAAEVDAALAEARSQLRTYGRASVEAIEWLQGRRRAIAVELADLDVVAKAVGVLEMRI